MISVLNKNLRVYALLTGSGIGTKPLQSLLDGHSEIIMIPAYPLVYLYPHWETWKKTVIPWNWDEIIKTFLEKHASVIDSRQIPGHNGLRALGDNGKGFIKIDEKIFVSNLKELLNGEEISSKNFILAVHFAYATTSNIDTSKSKVLIYHLHNVQYLHFFLRDFPGGKVIAMSRDPRPSIDRRIKTAYNVDNSKLNKTDAIIYKKYVYNNICRYLYHDYYDILDKVNADAVAIVSLEELYYNLESTMKSLSRWLNIGYENGMLIMTFGGEKWWGDKIYDMDKTNTINPRIASDGWKQQLHYIEWFIIEGLCYDAMKMYGYKPEKYKKDNYLNRLFLLALILIPSSYEINLFMHYCSPKNYRNFLRCALLESEMKDPLKDYTVNATYLYKWSYIDLKLWKTPFYKKKLVDAIKMSENNERILMFYRWIYIISINIKYALSVLSYPYTIFKRITIMYRGLYRRLTSKVTIPPLV